jgi:hypothetical protein
MNQMATKRALLGNDREVRHHPHRVVLKDVAVVHPLARSIVR